ncbi:uncharacterized protein LOC124818633 isoform X1 [Hydra vulgaris]|uniref:uncharacterized protein LOC124818633 isoform X1 n=1 Tax=Hydra vulgaris TaxID=6087 RepID=UPI0032E9DF56
MEQPGNDGCIHELMQLLQTLINQENPFALAFKNMAEVEDEEIRQAALEGRPTSVVRMFLLEGHDRRRYNLPSQEEVAIVFVGDNGAPTASREIVIYPRGQPLRTIASSVTSKLFYSLILDLIYGLIGFIAFLTFFYLSLAAASSVTSSKSWEDFRKYRSQHPGPLSMRAFHRWCLYGDDHPSFRWRDGTPYNTGNRADAGRRQRGSKVVNNFFTF